MTRLQLCVRVTLTSLAFVACAPAQRSPTERVNGSESLIQFRMASRTPAPGYEAMLVTGSGAIVFVAPVNIVGDEHVRRVRILRGSSPELILDVEFTAEGLARLYARILGRSNDYSRRGEIALRGVARSISPLDSPRL